MLPHVYDTAAVNPSAATVIAGAKIPLPLGTERINSKVLITVILFF
jgi:hypothetical protein